jgi:hypothetical protein
MKKPAMAKDKKKKEQKEIRHEALKKLGIIFAGLLLLVNTFQLARFGYIVEKVDAYNKGVVDELGGFRKDIAMFGQDINEVRSMLFLPVKEYSYEEDIVIETEEDAKQTSETEQAVYAALSQIVEEQRLAQIAASAEKNTTELYNSMKAEGTAVGVLENTPEAISFKILDENMQPFFNVLNSKTEEKLIIQSALGVYEVKAASSEEIQKEIIDFINANKEKVAQAKALLEQRKTEISSLFGDLMAHSDNLIIGMKFSNPQETETSIEYKVLNSEDEELLAFSIARASGEIAINNSTYTDAAVFKQALEETLKGIDASTSSEKYINSRKAQLEAVFEEEAFKGFLKANSLTLEMPREEYNKIVYDLKDESGTTLLSFLIEISSGQYKILRNNEEIDLFRAMEEGSKKNF